MLSTIIASKYFAAGLFMSISTMIAAFFYSRRKAKEPLHQSVAIPKLEANPVKQVPLECIIDEIRQGGGIGCSQSVCLSIRNSIGKSSFIRIPIEYLSGLNITPGKIVDVVIYERK